MLKPISCFFLVSTFLATTLSAQTWYDEALQRIDQHRKADLTIQVVDWQGNAIAKVPVTIQMTRHAFGFGTAIDAGRLNGTDRTSNTYRTKLKENFNQVVLENDLKWPAWIGLWGNGFNWPNTQLAMDWCDQNQFPIRGHYLSWATWSGSDAWGTSDNTSTLPARLFSHITEKTSAVGSRIKEWDVINHPIGWTGTTYETFFGDQFYGDIIDHARSVVPPGVDLWINEDDILAGGGLADAYEDVIQNLINQGSPPDGIGFQCHFVEDWGRIVSGEQVYNQLVRFGNLIPRLQVTEFDIDVGADEQLQAQLMHEYVVAIFSHPKVEALNMWGFWEGQHWLPDAALYRLDWTEKPALTAYQDLVFRDWWTDESGFTQPDGTYHTRGFLGEHQVLVSYDGRDYSTEFSVATNNAPLEIIVGGWPQDPNTMTPVGQTSILSGDLNDLFESDNQKVVLTTHSGREVTVEIEIEVPSANLSELHIRFEGSTRSSIANVNQKIELFNFVQQEWVTIDTRPAKVLGTSLSDKIVELAVTERVDEFVEPGSNRIHSRFSFFRSGLTRRLTGYIDEIEFRTF